MKLIVGLGNPGPRYRFSRHNAGFLVLDQLAQKHGMALSQRLFEALVTRGKIAGESVIAAAPQTFMNLSGTAVRRILDFYRIEVVDLIVIHDDMDLPFGTIRLKEGGGHGGHKGLISVIEQLGNPDFLRVRIGIGKPVIREMVDSYVLSPFSEEEMQTVPDIAATACDLVTDIVASGVQAAVVKYRGKTINNFQKEG
ncbi:MAG: Peptidyl-tRNA hydrolase [Syntrophaceae bacterium PtaU1.Bin231]|nr:MAG: Peptidyl-tRNA hydrolase [Syntrophaceae bacterium PtaU1.Bin231]HOG18059.1 aminoacyl-tRNA hydrolase [Syntrophales bacterium]